MLRCLVCGSSKLDPEGYKCALCGGAPGLRAEECYITEGTKAKLRTHADELKALGVTLEEYAPVQKSFGETAGVIALAIQIADSLQGGSLRKLILYLRDIGISHEEIVRLRLDEPGQVLETLRSEPEARPVHSAALVKAYVCGCQRKSKDDIEPPKRPSDLVEDVDIQFGLVPRWKWPSRELAESELRILSNMRVRVGTHFCTLSVEELPEGEFTIVCLSHTEGK